MPIQAQIIQPVWMNSTLRITCILHSLDHHDDVIKWKQFPRYWSFVRGIHRSPVNSPHKGQWRGALMMSLICTWTNDLVNNRDAGDLKRHGAHCDVTAPIVTSLWRPPAWLLMSTAGSLYCNFNNWRTSSVIDLENFFKFNTCDLIQRSPS